MFCFGKSGEKFCGIENSVYICSPEARVRIHIAEIAQLVERNLAKVEVAGPSPVFRSKRTGRAERFSLSSCILSQGGIRHPRPQNTPFRGRGCRQTVAEPLVRSASASPVFRSRGGQKETPKESKKPCMSAIYKAFSFVLPLLLKQKAASISGLNRDLFCPDRKQVTIWLYFADLHYFTLQHSGAEDV